ncbi:MAG: GAF domain-containing protein [Anaerolineae bacterium]|nr:GAF domain-containing protein [Anaerolineae bacterium]
MSASNSPGTQFLKPAEFRGNLARNIFIILLALSFLPVGLIGIFSTIRSRQILRDQTYTQIQSITRYLELKIESEAITSDNTLRRLIADPEFTHDLEYVLKDPANISSTTNLRFVLRRFLRAQPGTTTTGIDTILLVNPDGLVINSTNINLENQNFLLIPPIRDLAGKNNSFAFYDPQPFYPGKLVIFNSRRIEDAEGNLLATAIAATLSPTPAEAIRIAKSFFPTANAYILTSNFKILSFDEVLNDIYVVEAGENFSSFLTAMKTEPETPSLLPFTTFRNVPMLYYGRKLHRSQSEFIVEVPEAKVYQQISLITPLNAALLAFSILVVGAVVFTISTRLVRPLNQLVNHARRFTAGDWTQRAKITRRDEIGLLAYSFNSMVEQLSELYRSLERKVEERTTQIRLASEIAQIATSATARGEILKRTVELLVERFGYLYVRAFVLDEAGAYAILQEESTLPEKTAPQKGLRLRVGDDSLIGWVAAHNQARLVANTAEAPYPQDPPISGCKSQVALPIAAAGQTLGILDIQSDKLNNFDLDTVSVLQTLATQIANGLQNIRLLEATAFNLQETTLYYRASRQITLAQEENEVLQLLINTLEQTPYVTGVYTVQKEQLTAIALNDPNSQGAKNNIQNIPLPQSTAAQSFHESTLMVVNDLAAPDEFEPILTYFSQLGCNSAALFPIWVNGDLSKVVVIASREKNALSETSLQPLANLLGMTSTTLERFEIQKTLKNRISELQLLSSISQAISGVTDMNRLYEILHQQITQRIGEDVSFLMALYDNEANTIEVPYLYDGGDPISLDPFPADEGLISRLIHSRTPIILNQDAERKAQELGAKILGKPAKSWLGIPLIFASEVIGAIVVQDAKNEDRFTDDIVSLISTIAPQAAIAIRNAQLLNRMEEALKAYGQERFLLNTHLGNTPDFLYFKDSRGQYIRASRSYAEYLGLSSPFEMIGKTDFELQGQEIGARIYQEEQDFLLSGETRASSVEKFTDEDGNETYRLTSHIAMRDEGGITVGLLGISRDITEMKKTEQLAQHTANQLLTASEIARDTAGTLQLEELLSKAVNLILSRFDFYHSSIFLLDALGEYAVLRESTGPAGERLKAARHKLAVGSQSLVGQATARKEPVVVNDVTASPDYYPNPLLPETRSELVIPLKIGERVLGALDVQSKRKDAFNTQDVATLQILADQLAIAVYNANLFTRSQSTLVQHRLLYQITTAASTKGSIQDAILTIVEGLRETMNKDRIAVFFLNETKDRLVLRASAGITRPNTNQVISLDDGVIGQCARERQPVLVMDVRSDPNFLPLDEDTRSRLAVPIIYSNDLMGVLLLESPSPAAYDENDREILATLGNSLGAILYNTQLLEQIQSQVRRQQIIYSATSRIRRSVDIHTIMETTASEICQALGAVKAFVEINPEPVEADLLAAGGSNGHDVMEETGR